MSDTVSFRLSPESRAVLDRLRGGRSIRDFLQDALVELDGAAGLTRRLRDLQDAVEAGEERLVDLEADLERAKAELEAVQAQRADLEAAAAQAIEGAGQRITEQVERILTELTEKVRLHGDFRQLVGQVAADLPLAVVFRTMQGEPEKVTAALVAPILARLSLWSAHGGLNPEGPPPEAVSRGNTFLRLSRLNLAQVCQWGLALLAGEPHADEAVAAAGTGRG